MAELNKTTGFSPDITPEIVQQLKSKIKEIYGSEINLDDSTSDVNLVELIAQYSSDFQEKFSFILNQLNPNIAEDIYLNNTAKVMGTSRRAGKATIITAQLNNKHSASITLDNKSSVFDGVSTYNMTSSASVTLGALSSKVVNFICSEIGEIQPTLFKKSDWSLDLKSTPNADKIELSENNLVNTTLGYEKETDEAYRLRLTKGSAVSLSTLSSLYQKILEIEGVYDCLIIENDGTSKHYVDIPTGQIWSPKHPDLETILGNGNFEKVPLNSLYIIVEAKDESLREVAETIRTQKSDGVGLYNFGSGFAPNTKISLFPVEENVLSNLFGYTRIRFQKVSYVKVKCEIKSIPRVSITAQENISVDENGLRELLIRTFSTNNGFNTQISAGDIEKVCDDFDSRFRFRVKLLSTVWEDGSERENVINHEDQLLSPWLFCEKFSFSKDSFTFLN